MEDARISFYSDDKVLRNWNAKVRAPIHLNQTDMKTRIRTILTKPSKQGLCAIIIFLFCSWMIFAYDRTELPDTKCLAYVHEYNSTYPITLSIRTVYGVKYRIAVITDLDEASKSKNEDHTWISYIKRGYLEISSDFSLVTVTWDDGMDTALKSTLSREGRGMELSELITFNGKLYTIDDRTGIVYQIVGNNVIPWVILSDGDGTLTKGFKGEWMAVRDSKLYVGGLGKEWTTSTGKFVNNNPQWVKVITHTGEVEHVSWVDVYNKLLSALSISSPGYLIHESAVWSSVSGRWYFLPRRLSHIIYDDRLDERRGANTMLVADEHFLNISVFSMTDLNRVRGFSSFKFVPGTNDEVIIALKTEENQGTIATYLTVFDIHNKQLVAETKIGDMKYEGLEFV